MIALKILAVIGAILLVTGIVYYPVWKQNRPEQVAADNKARDKHRSFQRRMYEHDIRVMVLNILREELPDHELTSDTKGAVNGNETGNKASPLL